VSVIRYLFLVADDGVEFYSISGCLHLRKTAGALKLTAGMKSLATVISPPPVKKFYDPNAIRRGKRRMKNILKDRWNNRLFKF
jgi:hypothetical protein